MLRGFSRRFKTDFFLTAVALVAALACLAFCSPVDAQQKPANQKRPTAFWPDGVEYDKSIPTPKDYLDFDIGMRHLNHAQVVGYLEEVAEASDRVTIQKAKSRTAGGRPLLLLTITSEKNRKRLGAIKNAHKKLTKQNSDSVETENLPAVINMGYGVHGDESSATNCAPLVAYYLAAAQGEEVEKWLDDCVILLDPSLNPDGFNRFANWANRYRGRIPSPDPQDAEHNQMWPPGRVNYYWFDLNRDWLPLVHIESRMRMQWYHQWKPNVVLDFHEMGTNSTYFFQPGIPTRTNPWTPEKNQALTRKFASYHSKALDKRGSLYFTQERFDDFYMGKGSTYPDLHGSVGILFEQASSRGHVQKNQDGILRFHDTIANHFSTSLSSLRATSAMRTELINFKKGFYKRSLEIAKKQKHQTHIFQSGGNRSRLKEFAQTLKLHDIQVYWLKEDIEYGDQKFLADDAIVVPADQPEHIFLRSLLNRQTDFEENIFYDVSSWTLPLAYGLTHSKITQKIEADKLVAFKASAKEKTDPIEFSPDDVTYLINFRDDQATRALSQLFAAGVSVRVAKKPFTVKLNDENAAFEAGTLSVVLGTQKKKQKTIERILSHHNSLGAKITPVKSGLSVAGPDIGSSNFPVIEPRKVAMLIGRQASAYGAGEVWHLFDTKVSMPITMLKADSFNRADLSKYTTLVLPDGRIDSDHWSKINSFADQGGTVIAIGRVARSVQSRLTNQSAGSSANESAGSSIQKPFDSAATTRALKLISGAIFKTKIDTTHPLLYGMPKRDLPVFRTHASFLVPSRNPYCNPVIYDSESPLMAGYCSKENVERFKGAASVVVHPSGKGQFILMADNPNFRGFWKATSRVFLNAVFFGDLVKP